MITLVQGDGIDLMRQWNRANQRFDCIFMDPPDNIGFKYPSFVDRIPATEYRHFLFGMLNEAIDLAPIVWISFNSQWTAEVGSIVTTLLSVSSQWRYRACVQTYTFGQYNARWLGRNHRPLWCLYHKDAKFYPDAIKVQSWRQANGDKRAAPGGRVPGDVFDFPRVTGNSKQRRAWFPTQLNEQLMERVIKFSTVPGDRILDPFAGSGTTAIVSDRLNRQCTTIEIDPITADKLRASLPENSVRAA